MGIAPLIFTGVSQFSDDFQTILQRSVAIASLPLQQLQYEQADLVTKKQLLTDLGSVVNGLATAIENLGATGDGRGLSVSSTNTARVTVSLNGATQAGSYTISDITSVAKAASETSVSGFETETETAVSGDGTMELVVGSDTYEVDLTGEGKNNLEGLRDAINALGAGVNASILNTGTGATPYYLSITATATGSTTLELRETAGEGGTNILTAANQGADAIFKLNGLDVTKADNVVNDVVDGLTFTIQSETDPAETVDLTLSSSRGELATGLAAMVSAYNSLSNEVSAQVGETAGLLSGDFIVREAQSSMRQLASYDGSGESMNRLTDLGIEFDSSGVMSFDQSLFYSLSNAEIAEAFDFMGSETTGFGALADLFTQISDPLTGLIKNQQDQYDIADKRLTDQISALGERIDYLQTSMFAKLQQADVLLAQLEAQQTLISASIDSLNLVVFGKGDS